MTTNRSRSNSPASRKRSRSKSPTSRKKARVETADQSTAGDAGGGGSDAPPFDIDAYLRQLDEEVARDRANPLIAAPPPVATPATVVPKPDNPHLGRVKPLRANFGKGGHEKAHFQSSRTKPNHGVWRKTSGSTVEQHRAKVKKWVDSALISINDNDDFVVSWKYEPSGNCRYLVSMDGVKVGYLSGSNVPPGQKPPAMHVEVFLKPNGDTVTAFPSDPSIF